MLVFFIVMLISSTHIEIWNDYAEARYWPMVLLVIAVVIFASKVALMIKKLPPEERQFNAVKVFGLKDSGVWRLLMAFVFCFVYAVFLPYSGFIPATIIFGTGISWLLGQKSLRKMLLTGIGVCIPIYIVFVYGLQLILPRGAGFLYNFSLWCETLVG